MHNINVKLSEHPRMGQPYYRAVLKVSESEIFASFFQEIGVFKCLSEFLKLPQIPLGDKITLVVSNDSINYIDLLPALISLLINSGRNAQDLTVDLSSFSGNDLREVLKALPPGVLIETGEPAVPQTSDIAADEQVVALPSQANLVPQQIVAQKSPATPSVESMQEVPRIEEPSVLNSSSTVSAPTETKTQTINIQLKKVYKDTNIYGAFTDNQTRIATFMIEAGITTFLGTDQRLRNHIPNGKFTISLSHDSGESIALLPTLIKNIVSILKEANREVGDLTIDLSSISKECFTEEILIALRETGATIKWPAASTPAPIQVQQGSKITTDAAFSAASASVVDAQATGQELFAHTAAEELEIFQPEASLQARAADAQETAALAVPQSSVDARAAEFGQASASAAGNLFDVASSSSAGVNYSSSSVSGERLEHEKNRHVQLNINFSVSTRTSSANINIQGLNVNDSTFVHQSFERESSLHSWEVSDSQKGKLQNKIPSDTVSITIVIKNTNINPLYRLDMMTELMRLIFDELPENVNLTVDLSEISPILGFNQKLEGLKALPNGVTVKLGNTFYKRNLQTYQDSMDEAERSSIEKVISEKGLIIYTSAPKKPESLTSASVAPASSFVSTPFARTSDDRSAATAPKQAQVAEDEYKPYRGGLSTSSNFATQTVAQQQRIPEVSSRALSPAVSSDSAAVLPAAKETPQKPQTKEEIERSALRLFNDSVGSKDDGKTPRRTNLIEILKGFSDESRLIAFSAMPTNDLEKIINTFPSFLEFLNLFPQNDKVGFLKLLGYKDYLLNTLELDINKFIDLLKVFTDEQKPEVLEFCGRPLVAMIDNSVENLITLIERFPKNTAQIINLLGVYNLNKLSSRDFNEVFNKVISILKIDNSEKFAKFLNELSPDLQDKFIFNLDKAKFLFKSEQDYSVFAANINSATPNTLVNEIKIRLDFSNGSDATDNRSNRSNRSLKEIASSFISAVAYAFSFKWLFPKSTPRAAATSVPSDTANAAGTGFDHDAAESLSSRDDAGNAAAAQVISGTLASETKPDFVPGNPATQPATGQGNVVEGRPTGVATGSMYITRGYDGYQPLQGTSLPSDSVPAAVNSGVAPQPSDQPSLTAS